jgi:hypothetical protein
MNISEHTRIFCAYINRCTLADLEMILEASRRAWQEQANGNRGSQDEAAFRLHSTIMCTLEKMSSRDRDTLANVVSAIVNRT